MTRTDRLAPRASAVYVVRFVRQDGRDVKHRYFARRHDAQVYADKITGYGKRPHIFTATVSEWREIHD
jgi:hypothetical protein